MSLIIILMLTIVEVAYRGIAIIVTMFTMRATISQGGAICVPSIDDQGHGGGGWQEELALQQRWKHSHL